MSYSSVIPISLSAWVNTIPGLALNSIHKSLNSSTVGGAPFSDSNALTLGCVTPISLAIVRIDKSRTSWSFNPRTSCIAALSRFVHCLEVRAMDTIIRSEKNISKYSSVIQLDKMVTNVTINNMETNVTSSVMQFAVDYLNRCAKAQGVTRQQIANHTGFSRQSVNAWFSKQRMTLDQFIAVAFFLHQNPGDLLSLASEQCLRARTDGSV